MELNRQFYFHPIKASFISVNYGLKYYMTISSVETSWNHQLWEFLNSIQTNKNIIPPGYFGKRLVETSHLQEMHEQQDRFFRKVNPEYLFLDMIEIGIYGFIFITSQKNYDEQVDKMLPPDEFINFDLDKILLSGFSTKK